MKTIHGTKQKHETYGLVALAWEKLRIGNEFTLIQPNDWGGKSIQKIIESHFDSVSCESKNKSRYIIITKTETTPDIIDEWLSHTKLRMVDDIGFYSMPGLFGWNKIDVGSKLLLDYLPDLKGQGADFGCGYGYLSRHILDKNPNIQNLYCVDCDDRAVEACQKNIDDNRAVIRQGDCTKPIPDLPKLDFIVMNPPFHDSKSEDRTLGQDFIKMAAHHLKPKGECWIVANTHMPYEDILKDCFFSFERIAQEKGFKIFRAVR